MKKISLFLISLLFLFVFIPSVNATEESDEVNVYIFTGYSCGFCHNAKQFFYSIEDEYGQYFELVEYEVWYDEDNAELMEDVAKYLDIEIGGVPLIVIGDETYNGFNESMEEDILDDILDEYEIPPKYRYDVIKLLSEAEKEDNNEKEEFGEQFENVMEDLFESMEDASEDFEESFNDFSEGIAEDIEDMFEEFEDNPEKIIVIVLIVVIVFIYGVAFIGVMSSRSSNYDVNNNYVENREDEFNSNNENK